MMGCVSASGSSARAAALACAVPAMMVESSDAVVPKQLLVTGLRVGVSIPVIKGEYSGVC